MPERHQFPSRLRLRLPSGPPGMEPKADIFCGTRLAKLQERLEHRHEMDTGSDFYFMTFFFAWSDGAGGRLVLLA